MARKHHFRLTVLFPAVLLAACSSTEKWPNLSDKLPDTAERNRVLERVDPSATPRQADKSPLSEADAVQLLATIENDISDAAGEFTAAITSWRESNEADRRSTWMGAQLALTRLSQTVSRVNSILFNDTLRNSSVVAQANSLKNKLEKTVAEAQQELAANAP